MTVTDTRDERIAIEPNLAPSGGPIRQSNLWKDAWRRYIRNKGALVAGATVLMARQRRRSARPT